MALSVIACKVMEREIRKWQDKDTRFVFLDQGLHRTPKKLRERIQQEIDQIATIHDDSILLGYGLCGNGITGLQAKSNPLIIPAVHDCIALFLGSINIYEEAFRKEPGTYFLSPGWIEEGDTPLSIHQQCEEKYGAEAADWIIEEEFKNYKQIALIDTKVCPIQEFRDEAKRNAQFLNLKYTEILGSSAFFKSFLSGHWGRDFIIIDRYQEVTHDLLNFRLRS